MSDIVDRLRRESGGAIKYLDEAAAEITCLCQQLAVAREGLEAIRDGDVAYNPMGWPDQVCQSLLDASQDHARDTLAKLDQMEEKP